MIPTAEIYKVVIKDFAPHDLGIWLKHHDIQTFLEALGALCHQVICNDAIDCDLVFRGEYFNYLGHIMADKWRKIQMRTLVTEAGISDME